MSRHLDVIAMRHVTKQRSFLTPLAVSLYMLNERFPAFVFILQAALYALEDGGMSVCRVEHKHFMAALSTVKPSLTVAQLEKCKLVHR